MGQGLRKVDALTSRGVLVSFWALDYNQPSAVLVNEHFGDDIEKARAARPGARFGVINLQASVGTHWSSVFLWPLHLLPIFPFINDVAVHGDLVRFTRTPGEPCRMTTDAIRARGRVRRDAYEAASAQRRLREMRKAKEGNDRDNPEAPPPTTTSTPTASGGGGALTPDRPKRAPLSPKSE